MYNYHTKLAYLLTSKKKVDNRPPLTYDIKGTHFSQLKIPSGVTWLVSTKRLVSFTVLRGSAYKIALIGRDSSDQIVISAFEKVDPQSLGTPTYEESWTVVTKKLPKDSSIKKILTNLGAAVAELPVGKIMNRLSTGYPWIGGPPTERMIHDIPASSGTRLPQLLTSHGLGVDAQTKLARDLGPQFSQLYIPDIEWQVASAWEQSSSGFQGIALVGRARDGSVIVSRFLVTPTSEDSEYPSWSISTSKLVGEPKVDIIIRSMNNNAHFGIKSIKGSPWVGGYPNEDKLKKIKGKRSLPELLMSAGFGSR